MRFGVASINELLFSCVSSKVIAFSMLIHMICVIPVIPEIHVIPVINVIQMIHVSDPWDMLHAEQLFFW